MSASLMFSRRTFFTFTSATPRSNFQFSLPFPSPFPDWKRYFQIFHVPDGVEILFSFRQHFWPKRFVHHRVQVQDHRGCVTSTDAPDSRDVWMQKVEPESDDDSQLLERDTNPKFKKKSFGKSKHKISPRLVRAGDTRSKVLHSSTQIQYCHDFLGPFHVEDLFFCCTFFVLARCQVKAHFRCTH